MPASTNKSILITPGSYSSLSTSVSQIDLIWYTSGVGTFAYVPNSGDLRSTIYNWEQNSEPVILLGGIGTYNNQRKYVGPYQDFKGSFNGISSFPYLQFYPLSGEIKANNISVNGIASFSEIYSTGLSTFTYLNLIGSFYDQNLNPGQNGQILSSTGTGVAWTSITGAGIVSGKADANQITFWRNADSITGIDTFVFTNGNVGINTTNPLKKLHVRNSGILIDGTSGLDPAPYIARFIIDAAASVEHTLADFRNNNGSVFFVTGSRVAIGNTNVISNVFNVNGGDALINNLTIGLGSGLPNQPSSSTALGISALASNTVGIRNVAVGFQAGAANTSGIRNVFVGQLAGDSILSGSNNTFVGSDTDGLATGDYQIAIGRAVVLTGSNQGAWGGINNVTRTNLGIGTFTSLARLHVETLSAGNMGLYIAGSPSQTADLVEINATTNGQNYFTINGIGSVGVYTNLPTQSLDVNGNFRLRGQLYDGLNTSGVNNQILISTGTGVAWTSVSLTGIITAFNGVPNRLAKFLDEDTIGNSSISDDGVVVSVGIGLSVLGLNTSYGFYGPGTFITNLNASNLTSGNVPSSVISGNYSGITSVGNLTQLNVLGITTSATFVGDGANLTNLNASNLTSGTVASARITGAYSGITSVGNLTSLNVLGITTSATFVGDGANLTNLNASNLVSGNVPSARVSGAYSGITSVGSLSSLNVTGFSTLNSAKITGSLYDSTFNPGTQNQLLISTGSGIAWTSVNVTGIITAFNGTSNRVTKFLDEDTIGNSSITDNGAVVTVGVGMTVNSFVNSLGFYGPGTNLTNLNATNLSSGTVPSAVVSGNYSGITSVGNLTQLNVLGITTSATFVGDGANLTSLNASNLASGTVPSARVSGAYSGITSVGNLTQLNVLGVTTSSGYFGPGTNLTNLNASNLASGTVASARVSGAYSGITSVGSLTSLNVTGFSTVGSIKINGSLYDSGFSPGTQNQLLISTGTGISWTSVNVTGIVTAFSGTSNRITKFLDEDTIGNSSITDDGTVVTVGVGMTVSSFVNSLGFYGPGTNLTNLDATNLSSGTVSSARVSGAYSGITSVGNLTQLNVLGITTSATFVGDGANLTSLNASNLASGTVPSARISGSYSGITSVGNLTQLNVLGITTSATFVGDGANLTSLNASNLASGTVPSARVSGSYSGITSVGNLTALNVTGFSTLTNVRIVNSLYDGSFSPGTQNQFLISTGTGIAWTSTNATGIITGTGTLNVVPKFGGPFSLTNSNISDIGVAVTVNSRIFVNGIGSFTGDISVNNLTIGLGSGQIITNTALGVSALNAITSGTTNVAVGHQAGIAISSGSNNTGVGASALTSNTTGNANSAFGFFALQLNTSGTDNVAIGAVALNNNTTSSNNVAVGRSALRYYNQFSQVAVGFEALRGNTTVALNTGTQNTAIGWRAGLANSSGSNNTFVGYSAGIANTSGTNNTFLGRLAGSANQTSSSSVGVGAGALESLLSGNQNTAIGGSALRSIVTGGTDNFVGGFQAMFSAISGSSNVVIGKDALYLASNASNNVAVGARSLYNVNSSNQVAIGYRALEGATATEVNTGTQNTAVGFQAGFANTSGSNNTFVGSVAGTANTSGVDNTFIGSAAGSANRTGSYNNVVGSQAFVSNVSGTQNNAFGYLSLYNNNGNNNTAFGHSTLQNNTSGLNNVAVGNWALQSNTTNSQNVAIGRDALRYYDQSNQTAVGYQALSGNSTVSPNTGTQNVALGYQAGLANTSGSNNSYLGFQAGTANTSGSNNVFVGSRAGVSVATGGSNVIIGAFSDATANSQRQIAIGPSVIPTGSNLGAWGGNTNATRTDLGIGTFTPLSRLHVETLAAGNMGLYIAGSASQTADLMEINATTGGVNYLTVTGIGSVGIYTSLPTVAFDVAGDTRLRGRLFDNSNSSGSSNQVLISTGTGIAWTTSTATGILTGAGTVNTVPKFNTPNSLTNSNITDTGSSITLGSNASVSGILTSLGFFGPGTNLTNLNASNLIFGTVPSSVVSGSYSGITSVGNLTQLNVLGITTSATFVGDGANLTNLNASNLTSGTVASARISGAYSGITSVGNLTQLNVLGITTSATFVGDGANLTNLNASNLASGIVASARISGAYSGITSVGNLTQLNVLGITTSATFVGDGANLTNLNASNLTSGTVASARISGAYSGITSVGNLTQINVLGVTTSGGYFGPGTNITNLNASNLASGTVPSAVVSGTYSGITSVGTLTQLIVSGFSTINNIRVGGALYDNSFNPGTSNQVLISTGTGIAWTTSTATGIVTGSGTVNTVPKFNTPNSLTNSNITDNGIAVTVNSRLNVVGIGSFTNDLIVNQITVGQGGGQNVTNTALGISALTANTTGTQNTIIGYQAGIANTSGSNNVFIGNQAAQTNNAGGDNIAIGSLALTNNISGANNVAQGSEALRYYTATSNQTAIGYQALRGNSTTFLNTGNTNTAVGYQAGLANTSGSGNTFIGYLVGRANTTGQQNTFVGNAAGYRHTTGSYNNVFGSSALSAINTGNANQVFGYLALFVNTSGSNNHAFGNNSLESNTTASNNVAFGNQTLTRVSTNGNNVAVGFAALRYTTAANQVAMGYQALQGSATTELNTGTQNTAIGYQAGTANTSGSSNVFVGFQAGLANTSGNNNTFIGNISGSKNTTGIENTGVGAGALRDNTSGQDNTAIGNATLVANTTGSFNNALGVFALLANTTGSQNQAIGYLALTNNLTGGGNVAVGHAAMTNNTSGLANVAIGNRSLANITNAQNNTVVGHEALRYISASNLVAVGYQALQGSASTELNTGTQNTALGYQAGLANTSGSRNTFVGYLVGTANTTGADNASFGNESLKANTTGSFNNAFGGTALRDNNTGQFNNAFGYQALLVNTSGSGNVAFGNTAMQANTTGSDNTAVGTTALVSNTTGTQNVAIGRQSLRYYDQSGHTAVGFAALQGNTTVALNTGTQNVAIGYQAGTANSSGGSNVFIGYRAGFANTSGSFNTVVGQGALALNTVGNYNTAVGQASLQSNTSGTNNTGTGHGTLSNNTSGAQNSAFGLLSVASNTTGNSNTGVGFGALRYYISSSTQTAVGSGALQGNVTSSLNTGTNNTALGASAGTATTSGSNNVFVGRSAGLANTSGSNNVFMGGSVGVSMTIGSNNTLIGQGADGAQGSDYQIALGQGVIPTASNFGAWGGATNATRTNLGVGTFSPIARIHAETLAAGNMGLYIAGSASQTASLFEVDATTNGSQYFVITGIGSVGIYTSIPTVAFDVAGDARLRGRLFDNSNSSGTNNQVLISTGTGIAWTTSTATGIVTGAGTINTVPKFNTPNSISNSNITDTGSSITLGSNVSVSGILTSLGFFGPGTNLTNLNASNLIFGTVPSSVVSGSYSGITSVGNLTQLNVLGITTSATFVGDGANLTNLNASNLTSGTVASARISGSYSGITSVGNLTQLNVLGITSSVTFVGDGANLTNLNASNLAFGTVASARISGSYSGITSVGNLSQLNVLGVTTSGGYFGPGTNLTNLNASNLASGTVPSAVVSGAYSGITSVGTLTQLNVSGFSTVSNLRINNALYDGSFSPGTNNQVLISTGTGISWTTATSTGIVTGTGAATQVAYWNSTNQIAGNNLFVYNGIGSVGIGTIIPEYALHVVGTMVATIKSFIIEHPTKPGKKLRYASLEGPENGVYVRGRSTDPYIILPNYWVGLVDENTITVNITPVGSHQNLYVEKIEDYVVYVKYNSIFNKKLDYFYTVYGERKDVNKLEVEI